MKKEFIMVDLTTGGKAIIRISLIEDIYDDCNNGVFQKSVITSKADFGNRVFESNIQTEEIYTMIITEST